MGDIPSEFLAGLPHYAYWKDTALNYLGCNAAFAALCGLENPEAIVGKHDTELGWSKELSDALIAADRKTLECPFPSPTQHTFEAANGDKRILLAERSLLRDAQGAVIGLLCSACDITALQQSVEVLQEKERYGRSLQRLSRRLELADQFDDVLRAARDEVEQSLDYHTLWVYLLQADGNANLITISGDKKELTSNVVPVLDMNSDPFLREIARGDHLVVVEDARTDPRTNKEIVAAMGNVSLVNVPIWLMDRHLGMLGTGSFASEGVHVPGEAGLSFLEGVASHVAVALDRIHAYGERHKLAMVVAQSSAAVAIADTEGTLEYLNPRYAELLPAPAEAQLGQPLQLFGDSAVERKRETELWQAVLGGREWRGEVERPKADGTSAWEKIKLTPLSDRQGRVTHVTVVREDITLRKNYEAQLLRKTNYDDITGLPNRTLANDRLAQALKAERHHDYKVALLIIDLDHFIRINDTFGHDTGDRLLQAAGQRLLETVRHDATVARLGGDEFAVILPYLESLVEAEHVARRIASAFEQPFSIEGSALVVTASIGITVFPDDGLESHVLMQNADAAVHRAKQRGRHQFHFFTSELNDRVKSFVRIEQGLRLALARGELQAFYQPLVDAGSGHIEGFETLLRWHSHDYGMVRPDQFIPVAEETGLIVDIGEWVLEQACRQAALWRTQYAPHLRIAVNVSVRQFSSGNITDTVARILSETGLPAEALELEITESLLMADAGETIERMRALSALGVGLSIDDFGTGYSSLSYIRRFPIDTIKIDRSFIRDVDSDPEDAQLVEAIIAMAHSLRLQVVAEGVETTSQRDFAHQRDCELLQGFLYAKPLPPEEAEQLLSRDVVKRAESGTTRR